MDADDDIKLSPFALEALSSFYSERDAREKQFEDLKTQAEDDFEQKQWSMEAFTEDWNASQFWYSDATATALAKELLDGATKDTHIAVVSAPSVFLQLKNLTADVPVAERPKMKLLEIDERFQVFRDDFVPYDFGQPFKLPEEMKGQFDRLVVDPPFLSNDCQTKAAMTVRWLSRPSSTAGQTSPAKLIICTGERMQQLILKLYEKAQVKTTTYRPIHARGLSNEFFCYANFACSLWSFEAAAAA